MFEYTDMRNRVVPRNFRPFVRMEVFFMQKYERYVRQAAHIVAESAIQSAIQSACGNGESMKINADA